MIVNNVVEEAWKDKLTDTALLVEMLLKVFYVKAVRCRLEKVTTASSLLRYNRLTALNKNI